MKLNKKFLLAAAAAALLAGCSSPAARMALKSAGLASTAVYYVQPSSVLDAPFSPPPAADSEAQARDLAEILAWQNKRTAAECEHANVTSEAGYEYYLESDSPFGQPLPAEAKEFFDRVSADLAGVVSPMKDRYKRPRPYKAYPDQAQPCIKKSWGYSYPSGHSAYSRVFAEVMGDIEPARKAYYVSLADGVALDRVIGGVHFPTDIAAGKAAAVMFHEALLKSPAYQADVQKMRGLLKK